MCLASRQPVKFVVVVVFLAHLLQPEVPDRVCDHRNRSDADWVSTSVVSCVTLLLPPPNPYWAVQWSWFARVNALCNLSCKKSGEVTASLLGRFLSRHCFTLCITVEVEPRIAKQYKWQHCCSCKNYQGKGMEGGKKVALCCFLAEKIRS